jgi:hypothetical protein
LKGKLNGAEITSRRTPEEDAFLEICWNISPPMEPYYTRGKMAYLAGVAFDKGPRPLLNPRSLSWRIGWNEMAAQGRKKCPQH